LTGCGVLVFGFALCADAGLKLMESVIPASAKYAQRLRSLRESMRFITGLR
jgi:hypothetical protein